jgi:uncharacterized caspase-like protein/peptidoglycan hydrolase-like protein with peptidoglycan-binding domain
VEDVTPNCVDSGRRPSDSAAIRAGAIHGGLLSRCLRVAGAAVAGVAFLVSSAFADAPENKRVALVIGNGAYENAPKLDNARFDARAVADAFRKLGFMVVDGYDLDIAGMRAKVSEFSADLPDAKSAVIYYAGHGISVDEENYLIPTDITLRSPTDLDLSSISVSLLLRQMKREDRVNVVVLDACRDNPFTAALARSKMRAMVGERGLSRIEGDLARGTLIAFASDPKSTAFDGPPGQHSPFTEAFLNHVFDPDVSIETVMSRVRTEVWEKTHHNQLPWVNTSLIGDYFLNPPSAPERAAYSAKTEEARLAAPGVDRQSQEDLLWESAQHSNLSADYQAYLDAFPNGLFARMAKNRIVALQNAAPQPVASVGQPSAAAPQSAVTGPQKAATASQTVATAEPTAPAAKDWKAEIGAADAGKALDATPAAAAPQPAVTAPETVATAEPTAPAAKDWKAEIGTADTERALDLAPAAENEIQQRLMALDLYKGPATGVLDPSTRSAITAWQRRNGVALTSFLGPMQLAELRAESEDAYHKLLAAQPAPAHAAKQIVEPATTRAAKAPAKAPVRSLTKQSSSAPAKTAAATSVATPACNGNPKWCRKAGLADNQGALPTGQPSASTGGSAASVGAGMLVPFHGFHGPGWRAGLGAWMLTRGLQNQ